MDRSPTWFLSNLPGIKINPGNHFHELRLGNFTFYHSGEVIIHNFPTRKWVVIGDVLPRLDIAGNYKSYAIPGTIDTLFEKFKEGFINKIKGEYLILYLTDNEFRIYSDRFAIKKYFFWGKGKEFLISNNLKIHLEVLHPVISFTNLAIYYLTAHFIGGITPFENISTNRPAEILQFQSEIFSRSCYWDPKEYARKQNDLSITDLGSLLELCLHQQLEHSPDSKISLSLTGGADSRLLLSLLLKRNCRFTTYTYGDRGSADSVIASKIAGFTGITHSNYEFPVNSELFKSYALKTIELGQSLASIHRAHRLWAIEKISSDSDLMILGTMGGEFIKGGSVDNYSITRFVEEFCKNPSEEVIIKNLETNRIKIKSVDISFLRQFFMEQRWCQPGLDFQLYTLTDILAGVHHAQNELLYSLFINRIYTPYIDIDYLEALLGSPFCFLNKKPGKTRLTTRLNTHRFACHLQNKLNSLLSSIPYNSGIVPTEFVFSPFFASVMAKARKSFTSYKINFPLENWMNEFATRELKEICMNDETLNQFVKADALLRELEDNKTGNTEAFWLKYTNPIQFKFIKDYLKS